jgi:hypothetical protein
VETREKPQRVTEDVLSAGIHSLKRFIKSPKINVVEVLGGDRAIQVPCTPLDPGWGMSSTHVFSGKEREVIKIATDWAIGNQVPNRIDP